MSPSKKTSPADASLSADAIVDWLENLAEQHDLSSAAFRIEMLAHLKAELKSARKAVEARLMDDGKGTACAQRLSVIQDELICALYRFASTRAYPALNPSTSERVSVVAVGGYGRGTLAPGSDIDLLFVLPYKQTGWSESVIEYILYMLWDLGFKVGHSTRSIDECIRLAKADGTIMTAVLEARYVCGDRELCDELNERFRSDVIEGEAEAFIADKLAERDVRHQRAGESRYLVEPDVKDGKGGLRDLHTLFWIAKFLHGTQDAKTIQDAGIFTSRELNRFMKCEDFLWAVRCHMHFLMRRGDDRLNFDKQAELAERLGYTAHGGLSHVERFMRHYFLIAKDVGDLTRIFCSVLESQHMKLAPRMSRFFSRFTRRPTKIKESADFHIVTGRINVKSDDAFAADPVNLIRLFALADKYDVGIHPNALKLVRRSLSLIKKDVRNDPEANRLFIDMLTGNRDPETVLRRMNEAGVLGKFVPEFGKIVAMMQFNMYHHYTVDEHLLRSIGALAEIKNGAAEDELPLSTDIIHTLRNSKVLYVAVFLHDIAKGRKEDHSIAGEKVAKSLCPRFGLTPSETETVAWLVRHHLLMSETAQMRDLNDYKTILDFAAVVQSPERLKLLLILTAADIRAVGPGVWNGWKGQLLRTLYFETEPVVSGGHSSVSRQQRVEESQSRFIEKQPDWSAKKRKAYLARHYGPYWLNVDLDHQLAHAEILQEAERTDEHVATRIKLDAFTAITEIAVVAPDHPRLLAQLTGACAATGANIASAQIFTTTDGMALDTLLIQRQFQDEYDEQRRAQRITDQIGLAIRGQLRIREAVAKARQASRRTSAFTVAPQVVIDNDSSHRFTVLEVAGLDRIGLLFELTDTLFRLNLNIGSAHITTFGERAVDVFYVTDLTGGKITNANRRAAIHRQLMTTLAPEEAKAKQKLAS